MSPDFSSLRKRLDTLNSEVTYNTRKRKEEAERYVAHFSQFSEEDIKVLAEFVPDIVGVSKFTVDDILNNANGEVQRLQRVYEEATSIVERMLTHYEGMLC